MKIASNVCKDSKTEITRISEGKYCIGGKNVFVRVSTIHINKFAVCKKKFFFDKINQKCLSVYLVVLPTNQNENWAYF